MAKSIKIEYLKAYGAAANNASRWVTAEREPDIMHSGFKPDSIFTAKARTLGIVAAWMSFAVSGVYAVVSGLAYASEGAASPASTIKA